MLLPIIPFILQSPKAAWIDLSAHTKLQTIVDREPGQYLGHPTTALLRDGKTILCVYPKGHGKGAIVYKKSSNGGKTWSKRLPTPENWKDSQEVPTLFQTVDQKGKRRIVMFSGLYPAKVAISEDDGKTWSPLESVGNWGGIVVMGTMISLPEKGSYLALFHDDGRFFSAKKDVTNPVTFINYSSISVDGGVTWQEPKPYFSSQEFHYCEPGAFPIPKSKKFGVFFRENSRKHESGFGVFDSEKQSWSEFADVNRVLTGDRHTAKWMKDGRLFVTFRDMAQDSPWKGDWVAWIGTLDDIVNRREGQFRIRLMDNIDSWDCGYPGLEILKDGTIVTTTYGHWAKGEEPYIVSIRIGPMELNVL